MNSKSRKEKKAPALPRFVAPKKMTSVKFISKKDKLKRKRVKKIDMFSDSDDV